MEMEISHEAPQTLMPQLALSDGPINQPSSLNVDSRAQEDKEEDGEDVHCDHARNGDV